MKIVKIDSEFITLGQFLKYVGIIDSGAMAKMYLKSNYAIINEEKEQRRGKKLYPNTELTINGETYKVKSK